jgi:hypothetical protein
VEMRAPARDSGSYRLWRWQAAARDLVVAWTPTDGGCGLLRRGRRLLQFVAVTASLTASGGAVGSGGSGRRAAIHGRQATGGAGNLHVRGTRRPVRRWRRK